MGCCSQHLTIEEKERSQSRFAKTRSIRKDRIENRLEVCRRATDDPENLPGPGLLLYGLDELAFVILQFFGQAGGI